LEGKHAFRGNIKGLEVPPIRGSSRSGKGRKTTGGGTGNTAGEHARGFKRGSGRGGGTCKKRGHDKKMASLEEFRRFLTTGNISSCSISSKQLLSLFLSVSTENTAKH
jgi:hypothetical protein